VTLTRRSAFTAAVLMALSLAGPSLADASFGPKVGSKTPDLGTLSDQAGKPQTLKSLAGKKRRVLVFYRSAGWCPNCQAQLMAMNTGAADIESRGFKIVGLAYDTPEVTTTFTDRPAITYTLLSDPK